MPLTAQSLRIPEVVLLHPEVIEDDRGYFFEAWNQAGFAAATGFTGAFVQDNQSFSNVGVIRGLHYQSPHPQAKLVRVISGSTFTVAVDIRASSSTFGQWASARLSASNRHQLWIPPGFAHGFMAISDSTEIIYKVTALYAPGCDRVIRWDDPAIGIEWPTDVESPVVSAKDRAAPLLADAKVFD